MQAKGTHALRSTVAWHCFGIRVPHSAFQPKTCMGVFISYTILAMIYRWVVFLGILGFMYQLLKPYRLEVTGMGLACISMLASSYTQGKQWHQIFSAPRREPMNKFKMAFSGMALLMLMACIAFVPIPWYIEAPCFAQPERAVKVFATTPGILEDIWAQPGQAVETGQRLFQLKNDELIDRMEILKAELETALKQREIARSIDDSHASRMAEERELALRKELEEVREWLAQTTVIAPLAGRIVAPSARFAEDGAASGKLVKWTNTPLHPSIIGAFIESQTHLCTIAPATQFEVVMLVEQEDSKHVMAGATARVKLYGHADRVIVTKIAEVAERAAVECPPELCALYGGSLAATPTAEGSFTLTRGMVQARACVDIPADHLRTGLRGSARILVHRYSVGGWAWHWLVTKIWFRL